jgi:hypothetical protein
MECALDSGYHTVGPSALSGPARTEVSGGRGSLQSEAVYPKHFVGWCTHQEF